VFTDDDCVVIFLPEAFPELEEDLERNLADLVTPENFADKLRKSLEGSAFFGSIFREVAVRSLLLPRSIKGKRVPLWLTRARAKVLHGEVAEEPNFPAILETWRECLEDRLDTEGLRAFLEGLSDRSILVQARKTSIPSPFSRGVIWLETNDVLYQKDNHATLSGSSVSESVIREALDSQDLGSLIEDEAVALFERKTRRLLPGYAPTGMEELGEWLKERGPIGLTELQELCADSQIDPTEALSALKLVTLGDIKGEGPVFAHPSLAGALDKLIVIDSYHSGPFTAQSMAERLSQSEADITPRLEALVRDGTHLRIESGNPLKPLYCDRANAENILKLQRRLRRPSVEPMGISWLQPFLALWQGVAIPQAGADGLRACLDKLALYPAKAGAWQERIFPLRVRPFSTQMLDGTVAESELFCFATPEDDRQGICSFCFPDQAELRERPPSPPGAAGPFEKKLAPEARRFWAVKDGWNIGIEETKQGLWKLFGEGQAAFYGFAPLRDAPREALREANTDKPEASKDRARRVPASRWKTGAAPLSGEWFDPAGYFSRDEGEDSVAAEERNLRRVRLLMERYGILFRALLERELPEFRWGRLFKAMRRLELSGELISGLFFEGINGPQFMSRAALDAFLALRDTAEPSGQALIYALPADDPASLAGVEFAPGDYRLPARLSGSLLVFSGNQLLLSAAKSGQEITLIPPPEDPIAVTAIQALISHYEACREPGQQRLSLKKINDGSPLHGPYAEAARQAGFMPGYQAAEYYFKTI
jgi:ATP-dependent Lhr-like helicase